VNKFLSFTFSLLSLLIVFLLIISSLLTSEKNLKFLLNLNQDSYVDIILQDSHWHPYKPSLEIDALSVRSAEGKSNLLEIKELKIEFNLFFPFQGRLIERLYAKDMNLFISGSSNKDQANINDLWAYVSNIRNLKIEEFSLTDSNNLNTLKGGLSLLTLNSGESKLKFSAKNRSGGDLNLIMHSIVGSQSLKDYKGYVQTSNFDINSAIIRRFCVDCPSGILDSSIWFTFIDLELVKFLGDIKFKLNSSIDFINSINAKIELEDTKNNIFRISSFINENQSYGVPDIFTSFTSEEVVIFIPEMELGKDKLINRFKHLLDLPKDFLLKGYINNLILNLHDSLEFKANFEDLSLKSNELSITGLKGNFNYTPGVSRLKINTPYLKVDSGALYDNPLIFNDLRSELDLKFIDKKVSISNSAFKVTFNKALIKGQLNLFPSPYDVTGDISIKIYSNELDYSDALNLFPNLNYTEFTKSWLQKSISCGSLQEASFIFRGPVDGQYQDSSSSFQSKGLFNNSCLNISDVDIKSIKLISKFNNSSFVGEILHGDLYGSKFDGTIKIFKDNNHHKLELKGESKGPFQSILRLSNLDQAFDAEEESGEHHTNFYFISPLSSTLDLLGVNSNLRISAKVKGGSFNNKKTNLDFSDFYSSIEYDSSNGIKDGFATIKINKNPIKFDIRKVKEKGSFNTQLIAEDIFSVKKILAPFNIKKEIRGSSKFKIKLNLSSFIKGQPFIDPQVEVLSNLEGIAINLPEPLMKTKSSKVSFNLAFKPFLNKSSLLSFKYGDLFRGKFNFNKNTTEGFVIAGKKKQNISIEDEKILLVGELQKLDLGSFISLGLFKGEGSGNIFIKDLLVQETNLSNLSLQKTKFKSSRGRGGIQYKFINDDLSGILLVPEGDKGKLSFKFDFIKINQPSGSSEGSFLSLYNEIKDEFDFSADAIFFNGQNYGNWKFSILPETNKLTLYNIKGTYGRWGVKNTNEGISSLIIFKNSIGWTSNLKANIYSGSPEKALMQIGIKPNFELGTLSLDADLNWNNLPWLFDYNLIQGEVSTNLSDLTIRSSENLETTNNLLRLVSIFNITDSFEKVTNLDFRKKLKRGFSADSVKGRFRITNKSLEIKEPILIKSGSSLFRWTGEISRNKKGNLERLNLEVIMTLPLREYLPAYALVLGGPITAGVVYIAGKAFKRNLDKLSSGKWTIKGDISKPKTEFDGWFEDTNKK